MLKKRKMIKCLHAASEIACDGCGGVLWTPAHRGKMQAVMWEAWYSGPEIRLGPRENEEVPEDVHFCPACFEEAMEYIRGKKEEERNNNLKNQAEARKRFRSPSGDNPR
jgi:hypothetical protein